MSDDVIACMAPVADRIQVSEIKAVLQTQLDPRERARNFAGYEPSRASRRLVIEQNSVAGIIP